MEDFYIPNGHQFNTIKFNKYLKIVKFNLIENHRLNIVVPYYKFRIDKHRFFFMFNIKFLEDNTNDFNLLSSKFKIKLNINDKNKIKN